MKPLKSASILAIFVIFLSCENKENENPDAFTKVVFTKEVSNLTNHSVVSGGIIALHDNLQMLSRGVCWSEKENPTLEDYFTVDNSGSNDFSITISSLNAGSSYFLRAFSIINMDTIYGNQIQVETPDYILFNENIAYGTVTDIEGNIYKTVTIGSQTWMAQNLRTTKYRNGDDIPQVTDKDFWCDLTVNEGAYCYFEDDINKANVYGAYYNWLAATDSRNIAPEGWHVATREDWQSLLDYTNITIHDSRGLEKLREETSAHWKNSDIVFRSTNESGFTAIAAERAITFADNKWSFGKNAYFWTSSGTVDIPYYVLLNDDYGIFTDNHSKGFNIRCIKD